MWSQNNRTTTIYLIRHAEKADASRDTELSAAGKQRAQKLAKYFIDNNLSIGAIYSTPFIRTQQTVAPLANLLSLDVIPYKPEEMTIKSLLAEHAGMTALVVGHSNTIPQYINDFFAGKKLEDIPENEFDNLYIITVKNGEPALQQIKL